MKEWALFERSVREEDEDDEDEDDDDDVMVTVKHKWPQGAPDGEEHEHEFEYNTTHEDNTDIRVVMFEMDSDEVAGWHCG